MSADPSHVYERLQREPVSPYHFVDSPNQDDSKQHVQQKDGPTTLLNKDFELTESYQQQNEYLSTFTNQIAFFLLGFINNFAYVVITSGAKNLCKAFGKNSAIGVIQVSSLL